MCVNLFRNLTYHAKRWKVLLQVLKRKRKARHIHIILEFVFHV